MICLANRQRIAYRPPVALSERGGAERIADQVLYLPSFLSATESNQWFLSVRSDLVWQTEHVRLFGRRITVPRLVAYSGAPGTTYRYSGAAHTAQGWTPQLARLSALVGNRLEHDFNFVLANWYRDGSDCIGWHADDERDLGAEPVIATVSLGAERRFRLRSRRCDGTRTAADLAHGSLLLMWGTSQRDYKHCIARTKRAVGERISLTFRLVKGVENAVESTAEAIAPRGAG